MKDKGADQSTQMCRLACAFVVRKPLKTGFLTSRPIYVVGQLLILFNYEGMKGLRKTSAIVA